MGPPREHGGMVVQRLDAVVLNDMLQWGRRVNTAECNMCPAHIVPFEALQWGRRVNTAECLERIPDYSEGFLLQWGRRVNTAECARGVFEARGGRIRFNGAAA